MSTGWHCEFYYINEFFFGRINWKLPLFLTLNTMVSCKMSLFDIFCRCFKLLNQRTALRLLAARPPSYPSAHIAPQPSVETLPPTQAMRFGQRKLRVMLAWCGRTRVPRVPKRMAMVWFTAPKHGQTMPELSCLQKDVVGFFHFYPFLHSWGRKKMQKDHLSNRKRFWKPVKTRGHRAFWVMKPFFNFKW